MLLYDVACGRNLKCELNLFFRDDCENACHSDSVRATTPTGESTTFSVELMQGALVVSSDNNNRFVKQFLSFACSFYSAYM